MSDGGNALKAALKRSRSALLAVGAFSFCVNLLALTVSIYMMQVYDRVLTSRSVETLLYLTVVAGGALLLLAIFEFTRSRILGRISLWLERALAPQALARAMENAIGGRSYQGEALRDLASVRGFLGGSGVLSLIDAPWAPFFIVAIYLLHPLLGHVALAGGLVLFALALLNDFVTRPLLRDANVAANSGYRTAESSLRNAEVVDAMGLLPGVLARWSQRSDASIALQEDASNRGGALIACSKFIRLFIQVAALGTGAYLAVNQEISPGAMIGASIILSRALAPIEQIIAAWKQTLQAREAYARLSELFERRPLRPDGMKLPTPAGALTVENVAYHLPGAEQPILRGVSFAVRPGEAVAVVGPSAAGKSTLARLLVGARRPSAGSVRLDGADVFDWRRDDVGRHIGYLPQDVELFPGPVRENIARLAEDADPEMVVKAARMARVHDMILRLSKGYDTDIGDGGAFLSGGQRQRVALARALYGEPKLIVLDEPNANLDSEGEAALNQAIASAKQTGAAVVVIGHRPSILAQVDKVLVLSGGRVELFGPRAEVMQRLARRSVAAAPGSDEREAAAARNAAPAPVA